MRVEKEQGLKEKSTSGKRQGLPGMACEGVMHLCAEGTAEKAEVEGGERWGGKPN